MKRVLILMLVFIALAGLAGGLAWFHFVYKPEMIRGFIAAAPQPVSSVAVAEAREEEWLPRAPAIGTFRAAQGVDVAPQVGGVIVAINFDSGQDVKKGARSCRSTTASSRRTSRPTRRRCATPNSASIASASS